MSSSCGSVCSPPTINDCNCNLGDKLYNTSDGVSCFCSLSGIGGNNDRNNYCESIGSRNEWTFNGDTGGSCHYNSCTTGEHMGSGCCNGCCSIVGDGVNCTRNVFRGSSVCCWRDFICDSVGTTQCQDSGTGCNPSSCFSDSTQLNTCPISIRSMVSPLCQPTIMSYCNGAGATTLEWLNNWTDIQTIGDPGDPSPLQINQPCVRALYRNLYSDPTPGVGYCGAGIENLSSCNATPGVGVPSATGFAIAQQLMTQVFANYIAQGGKPDAQEGDLGSNVAFNNVLFDICQTNPGLCAPSLQSYCAQVTADYMINHIETLNWCGCYMDPSQYSKYTDLYQINLECTPTCNQTGVIALQDDAGTSTKVCQQSLCIIDDISIELVKSRVGNTGTGINFSQICSSCGGGTAIIGSETGLTSSESSTCSCILSGNTIDSFNSSIGTININQSCGSATCYAEQTVNGVIQSVPVACDSTSSSNDPFALFSVQQAEVLQAAAASRNGYILVIVVVVLIVLVIIYLILRPKETPSSNLIIPKAPKVASDKELADTQSYEDYQGVPIYNVGYQSTAYNSINDNTILSSA